MYKTIQESDLETIFPNTGEILIDEQSEQSKKNYISLYNLYRGLFTQYIVDKLDLEKYDNLITRSGLNFQETDPEYMDVYQYFTSQNIKYFYIRNNIYIERLDEEELNFLKNKLIKQEMVMDDETISFIEKTYQKLIFEDFLKNGEKCMIQYGPDSSSFFARNDSIVIGVRYDEFADTELSDKEWERLNYMQSDFLYSLIKKMNGYFKGRTEVPIYILKYDDMSVIFRIQEKYKEINNEGEER